MSARRTEMHRVQEIVRLHRLGHSARKIARQLKMGRETVRRHLESLETGGLLDGAPEALPAADKLRDCLGQGLSPQVPVSQGSSIAHWRPIIEKLVKKGAGPTPIHQHLQLQYDKYAGSLSSVKRLCLSIKRELGPSPDDVTMPVETVAGEIAQVDFGYVDKIYDPSAGVMKKAWIFVMTLGFSRYMFCEIVFDQKIQTWLDLHVRAFSFFRGVPRVIVPDNLKSAVIRAAFGIDEDPVINRSYRELARFYGFQVDPAPPRAPQKKGKVERDVRYIKESFFKTWESVDINVDRDELRRWLLQVASLRRHGTTNRVPVEVFEQEERPHLIPLPTEPWKTVLWKKAKLHRDCHLMVDRAFYSAPWTHWGSELWVRCTEVEITIYHDDVRIVTHSRVAPGKRSTVDEHLPDKRRELRHRSRQHWINLAQRMGPEVGQLVDAILGSDDVLLQLRRVQAVVTLLENYPPARAKNAAKRALHFECLEYQAIKNILSKGLDFEPLPSDERRNWAQGSSHARPPLQLPFNRKANDHGGL